MSTLTEIEAAVDSRSSEQMQELLLFVASKLRAEGRLPETRRFSAEQLNAWIAEDEADMRQLTNATGLSPLAPRFAGVNPAKGRG